MSRDKQPLVDGASEANSENLDDINPAPVDSGDQGGVSVNGGRVKRSQPASIKGSTDTRIYSVSFKVRFFMLSG